MAKAIVDYLGVRDSRPTPDLIFDEQAVPQNDSVTSAEFNLGKTQAGLEVVLHADTDVVLTYNAEDFTITIEYLYGDSFAESVTVFTDATSGSGTLTLSGEIARFVPPTSFPVPGKLKITTDDPAATGAISAWAEYVAR